MKNIIILLSLFLTVLGYAQNNNVGINTQSPSETLDVDGGMRVRNLVNANGNSTYNKIVFATEDPVSTGTFGYKTQDELENSILAVSYTHLDVYKRQALSFTSGAAGGVFAPALSAGASVGGVLADIMELTNNESNVVILAGMVGFLTGITRAPFTSAILVLEMTDRHSLIFHLMLAAIISSAFSLIVNRHSLYSILKVNYLYEIRHQSK